MAYKIVYLMVIEIARSMAVKCCLVCSMGCTFPQQFLQKVLRNMHTCHMVPVKFWHIEHSSISIPSSPRGQIPACAAPSSYVMKHPVAYPASWLNIWTMVEPLGRTYILDRSKHIQTLSPCWIQLSPWGLPTCTYLIKLYQGGKANKYASHQSMYR